MKQKITLLSVIFALLGICNTGLAQPIYQQSFDSPQFPPAGWTMITPAGNTPYSFSGCSSSDSSWVWVHTNSGVCTSWSAFEPSHTGNGMAGFGNSFLTNLSGTNNSTLITPPLNFSVPGAQYKISFWMFNFNVFGNYDVLKVYVSTSPTGPFTTPILTINPNSSSGTDAWAHYTVTVPSTFNGPANYIAFEAVGGNEQDYLLDDVSIDQYLPCQGRPASIISGPSSVCAGIQFSLADNTTPFSLGVTYRWQSRITGSSTFVDIPAASTNVLTTSIGIPTDFRLLTTCNNSGLIDTTAPYSVGINPFYKCYCGPATAVNLGGSIFPLIDSVSLMPGTLMNGTWGILPGYYAQYPASGHTTTNLQLGASYTVRSILSNFGANSQAWIDYDQNGTFDPSEWIDMAAPGASNIAAGTFTVPQTATLGLTGLRIRSGGSSDPNSACNNHDGETEDYVVNLVPAPPNDMSAILILQPLDNSTICANTSFVIKAVIENIGSASQSNVIVKATYGDGSVANTIYVNDQNTIAPFTTDTVTIGTISIPTAGTYTLKAYTALINDLNRSNDTAYSTIRIKDIPVDPTAINDTVCLGDTAHIGVNPELGSIFNWYNAPAGGTVVYTGTSMTIAPLVNTTVYYVSSSTSGVVSHLPSSPLTSGTEGCVGGITFDVTALNNLTVDSFSTRFNATGLQQVSVYYRAGSAVGNETNPNAWILVGTTAVNVTSTAALYSVNLHIPINLTSGDTYGFYLACNAAYSDGGVGGVYTDGNMQLDLSNGVGLCGTFSNPSTTPMFLNGAVYYHVGGSDCESNRVPVVAAVGPRPVIDLGPDRTICQSPTFMLNAGNPGGRYQWGTLNGSTWNMSPNDTNQTLHVDTSGMYFVVVNRYCIDSDTVSLVVEPLPFATGINMQSVGNTYYFSPSGALHVTGYYWMFGDGGTSTDSFVVHTYANSNPYHVTLVVYNSCGTDTLRWGVPTAVNNINNDNPLVLYPNPASSKLTISGNNNLEISDVVVINAVGAVVYKGDIKKAKTGTINISNLASGHYILRAVTSEGTYSQSFDVLRQ